MDELDVCRHLVERNGKTRWRLLQSIGVLKHIVTTVDANFCAGNVGGTEEREPHDVIPVHVRHKNIYCCGTSLLARQHMCAKWPRTAPHIADVILVAAQVEFDTGCVSAKCALDRKPELVAGERAGFFGRRKTAARGFEQRLHNLVANIG